MIQITASPIGPTDAVTAERRSQDKYCSNAGAGRSAGLTHRGKMSITR